MKRKVREELKALSQEVFGASSRYQKLINTGYDELVIEELDEVLPGAKEGDPDIVRKVSVPVKREDGSMQYVRKYHTEESIKQYMIERKVQLEQIRETIKKQQEEAKAQKEQEELAKKVQQELSGSAV
jgi:hypothetical protein